jgi:3-oxoacyl-[acyl-carrier-protein] synthase-1
MGISGIRYIDEDFEYLSKAPFYGAKITDPLPIDVSGGYTWFEFICINSISEALSNSAVSLLDKDTVLILSSTKGNISLIEEGGVNKEITERVSLYQTAHIIGQYFGAVNKPIVISNACISGVLAIITAKRLLESGAYKHAVVVGADVLSRFVVSGFQSLMAMSDETCRPFDKDRKGINLGEGAATVVMTSDASLLDHNSVEVLGEGLTNDANHISGPSRTGQELADAVIHALQRSHINKEALSFISAHGTATLFNDEMESKAFNLAGLSEVPLHSLKAYFGHTLGAAGVIESVMTIQSLRQKTILISKNYEQSGVPMPLNISKNLLVSDKKTALKTASGFGGCNAALVFSMLG